MTEFTACLNLIRVNAYNDFNAKSSRWGDEHRWEVGCGQAQRNECRLFFL